MVTNSPYSIDTRVKEVIAEALGIVDESSLTRSSNIVTDHGADSLDAIEIVMALEEEFDIIIELDENLQKFETVGGCIDFITEAVKQ